MIPTPSQTVGPFFGVGLRDVEGEGVVRVEGRLLDGADEPVPDGLLEVCGDGQFARCRTDEEGAFHFLVRHAAPFLTVTVFARGLLRHLNTRMYFPGEKDVGLESVEPGRRRTLVARQAGEILRFDIRLQGPEETVFFL